MNPIHRKFILASIVLFPYSAPMHVQLSRPENLRRSVDLVLEKLRGTKRLDLFECARVDSKYQIEEIVSNLAVLVKEGKFDHIGLSECRAETVRRANKASLFFG